MSDGDRQENVPGGHPATGALALGVDTGGTYTDAALVTWPEARVVDSAKALTTTQDLAIGVTGAIRAVLETGGADTASRIALVGLSTTLATNAIVEDVGPRVCLVLIGYDADLLRRFDLEDDLVTPDRVHVAGGHDGNGDERAPLDEAALVEALRRRRGRVEAFAVSAYFSTRNPDHERRACELVRLHGGDVPVTCGSELSGQLDSVRRATTVALNARLIPLLRGLVSTVRATLAACGVRAPLMVVKGDGSMVADELALERPVETILSGPAASVVGAWHLAGRRDAWVVDVGGTTTDIAALHEGLPRLARQGARIGGRRTMVEALDARTVGLGGDSHIRVEPGHRQTGRVDGGLHVGPRRVLPLSRLAHEHDADAILDELRRQRREGAEIRPAEFVVPQPGSPPQGETATRLLDLIGAAPRSLAALAEASSYGRLALAGLDELERHRRVLRAGFTPTDALHVLGLYVEHDAAAARLGAELLAPYLELTPEAFCERVVDEVSRRLAVEIAGKALVDEGIEEAWEHQEGAAALLARAFGEHPATALRARLDLDRPVILVGAPVATYGPGATARLHAEMVVPRHASVANAIGAVAGGVVQHLRVRVRPTTNEGVLHVLLPDGVLAVRTLEGAVELARERATRWLQERVHRAGADGVDVRFTRRDVSVPVRDGSGRTLVQTELHFTAVGKPLTGRH